MPKTYEQINERIRAGEAVVVTAEEMIDTVEENGVEAAAEQVDVVTTGTFAPMCSSGAFINFGHANPRIKVQKAWLNDVNAYAGLAAVDLYIGATEVPEHDPLNREHPGEFRYGGGHVIEDLVAGRDVRLRAVAYGTDCYPRRELDTWIRLDDLNEAFLCNPRNAYQNYNVAVNAHADRPIYTYMGVLKPELGNANYCSAGQLSPLLNDPLYRTIGIGTRIFLGGAQGYVFWQGTQHNPTVDRTEGGVPRGGAGTLSVVGDLKQMSQRWIRGVSLYGYGVSLSVGLGIPIPVLNEEIARFTAVRDEDIVAPIVDYSRGYPYSESGPLGHVSYAQLKTGEIEIDGRAVPTASLSSYPRAQEIAQTLKEWIQAGQFLLSRPAELLPSAESGLTFKSLRERPVEEEVAARG
ncbi:MAG: homocysteine biosynthesis protein [Armatimonadota bacterium]|nr:homocysteine biosynthesis protein [Armatimonadota bacterium]